MKADYNQKQEKKQKKEGYHIMQGLCERKEVEMCSVVIRSGYNMVRCTYSLDHMAAV